MRLRELPCFRWLYINFNVKNKVELAIRTQVSRYSSMTEADFRIFSTLMFIPGVGGFFLFWFIPWIIVGLNISSFVGFYFMHKSYLTDPYFFGTFYRNARIAFVLNLIVCLICIPVGFFRLGLS